MAVVFTIKKHSTLTMRFWRPWLNLVFLPLLAACAAYGPYHANTSTDPLNSVREPADGRYKFAFIEFGDQGSALDTSQRTAALEVIHDAKLPGRKSQRTRQIDVLVRQKIGQYEMLIVLDCKDYARPVDVKGVEEFHGLLDDVGANCGIPGSNSA